MKQSDYDELLTKDIYARNMSPKDPFATLPSRSNKPDYHPISKGVQRTEDLLA
jgi:hypothetical protein